MSHMRNKDGGESLGPDINPIVIKLLSMSPFLLDKLALSYPSTVTHEVDALILEHSWFLVGITGVSNRARDREARNLIEALC